MRCRMTPWAIVILAAALAITGGCSFPTHTRTISVVVPAPPQTDQALAEVLKSNLPDDKKLEALRILVDSFERQYREQLQRASERGKRFYDSWLQVLAAAASMTAVIYGVTK